MSNNDVMPFKKGILMTVVALIMVGSVSVILTTLDLSIWVVWMGMCLWAAFGMSLKMMDIFQVWISGAFGISLAYILTSGALDTIGLILGGITVLFFVFGMVTHRFKIICNNYTAIFLTTSTAFGIVLEPIQLANSILFGFMIFGVLPYSINKLLKAKKRS